MMRRISFLVVALIFVIGITTKAYAVDAGECARAGGEVIGSVCVPTQNATGLSTTPIPKIITNIANWIVLLFGSIAIIVFVICGFQYLFSVGDDAQAENAKRCMKWAVVGFIVGGLAFVVINLIGKIMTGRTPGL